MGEGAWGGGPVSAFDGFFPPVILAVDISSFFACFSSFAIVALSTVAAGRAARRVRVFSMAL
ncbi:MAG: hypothetical protein H0V17_04995 [Deltaproteobacteria bacterium]|nr:hypothetical protein [Deltaproteobacteria bacterium]